MNTDTDKSCRLLPLPRAADASATFRAPESRTGASGNPPGALSGPCSSPDHMVLILDRDAVINVTGEAHRACSNLSARRQQLASIWSHLLLSISSARLSSKRSELV